METAHLVIAALVTIALVAIVFAAGGTLYSLTSRVQGWLSSQIAEAVKAEMEKHEPLLRHLGQIRKFKTDKSIMTRFEGVEEVVNDLPAANERIRVQYEAERKVLQASVAAVSVRAGKLEGDVNLLKPDVAALNRHLVNSAIGGPAPIPGKTDRREDEGDSGEAKGSPTLKPQYPKP
jgi:hypothetical protein